MEEAQESEKGVYHIFAELHKSVKTPNKIEANKKNKDNEYINILQNEYHTLQKKIDILKNKYNELLIQHGLI